MQKHFVVTLNEMKFKIWNTAKTSNACTLNTDNCFLNKILFRWFIIASFKWMCANTNYTKRFFCVIIALANKYSSSKNYFFNCWINMQVTELLLCILFSKLLLNNRNCCVNVCSKWCKIMTDLRLKLRSKSTAL